MKVYLVTFDGYNSWGADIYALGAYSTREKAEAAVADSILLRKIRRDAITITELELDRTEKVEVEDESYYRYEQLSTDLYLGGYEE